MGHKVNINQTIRQVQDTVAIIRNLGGIEYSETSIAALEKLVGLSGIVRSCLALGQLHTNGTKIYA